MMDVDSRLIRARQAFMIMGMALLVFFFVFVNLKKPTLSSSATIYKNENYTRINNATIPNIDETTTRFYENENSTGTSIATIPNITEITIYKNEKYTRTNAAIPNIAETITHIYKNENYTGTNNTATTPNFTDTWKSGRDDPAVQKPVFFEVGVVAEKVLDVKCSRSYYCNSSICRTIQFPGNQLEMEDFLFRSNNNSKSGLRIQYWGDSVQAQMECDMRQWRHSVKRNSPSTTSTDTTLQSDYIQIGCPWRGCVPEGGWAALYNHTQQADVIFFNLGAHYEFSKSGVFEKELTNYEPVLQPFVARGGVLVVRSPSPTHFQSEDGLFTDRMRNALAQNAGNATCAAIDDMPTIIQHQDRLLRAFATRLNNSTFVDIFEISKDRFYEHTQPGNKKQKKGIDCKHFCQNCGLFRAWNALSVSIVMKQLAEVTKRREANRRV